MIGTRAHQGITPLIAASNSNHFGMVQLLLEKQADPTVCTATGETALYAAAKLEQVAALRVLLKSAKASADGVLNGMADFEKQVGGSPPVSPSLHISPHLSTSRPLPRASLTFLRRVLHDHGRL